MGKLGISLVLLVLLLLCEVNCPTPMSMEAMVFEFAHGEEQ